jgi:hypothetical protein
MIIKKILILFTNFWRKKKMLLMDWEKHKSSNFWMQHCTEILCVDKAWSLQIYWSLKQEEDAIGNGLIPQKKNSNFLYVIYCTRTLCWQKLKNGYRLEFEERCSKWFLTRNQKFPTFLMQYCTRILCRQEIISFQIWDALSKEMLLAKWLTRNRSSNFLMQQHCCRFLCVCR